MIYVLDRNLNITGLLIPDTPRACPYFNDLLTEKTEAGAVEYEFEVPADHETAKTIESEGYVARTDLFGDLILLKIRFVEDIKDDDGFVYRRVFAESAALELLTEVVRPLTLGSVSASRALGDVLSGTEWRVGTVEWLGLESFDFTDYPTVLSAVQTINETYGGDVVFRVEMDGGRVTGKYVDLLIARGRKGAFRFDYRYDIKGLTRTVDSSQLVTALIGVGQGDDSGGRAVTFTNVSGNFYLEDGTRIHKPVGRDVIENPVALQRWGRRGRHLVGVYKSEERNPAALLRATFEVLEKHSEPSISYEVDVATLRRITQDGSRGSYRLGDYGDVIDHDFSPSVMVNARIIERQTSFTDPDRDAVVLGNYVTYAPETIDIIADLQDRIRRDAPKWEQAGESPIYKAPTEPADPEPDALWIDTSQEPNILRRYDAPSGRWEDASPTQASQIGAETPGGAQDKAETEAGKAEDNAKNYADQQDAAVLEAAKNYSSDFVQEYGQKKITQSATAPTDPEPRELWIDTSEEPHVWKRWDGTRWVNASATSLEELAGELEGARIKVGSIQTPQIADSAINADKLLDAAVENAKIAAGAVQEAQILNGVIGSGKLSDRAVSSAKLALEAVLSENIGDGSIISGKIGDGAVTNKKVSSLDAAKITTGLLIEGVVQIGSGSVFGANYDPSLKETPQAAQDKADSAEREAKSYAEGQATTVKSEAISTAAGDATSKAEAAKNTAISTAATDATNKAGTAEQNAKDYALEQVEAIEVGARNYQRDFTTAYNLGGKGMRVTEAGKNYLLLSYPTEEETAATPYIFLRGISEAPEAGEEYTLAYEATFLPAEDDTRERVYIRHGYRGIMDDSGGYIYANQRKTVKTTFTAKTDDPAAKLIIYTYDRAVRTNVRIEGVRLYKGTKAGDWSPAPEDVEAYAEAQAVSAQQAAIEIAATDATEKANAAQGAAEAAAATLAAAEADAAETAAKAHADGIVTAEESARIKQAADNLAAAKLDATNKANTAKQAAIDAAALDATAKANAAQTAAEAAAATLAAAEADAAETAAKAHADGIVTAEEQARISQAAANLTAAKNDATTKANNAKQAAIEAAALDATAKANAAQTAAEGAAETVAAAEAEAARTAAIAHADGIVDAEEQARIQQAADNLAAAKKDAQTKADAARDAAISAAALDAQAKANAAQTAAEAAAATVAAAEAAAAETAAKAHADGIVTAEEQARISQAAANLSAAKTDATNKAAAAEAAAKKYAEAEDALALIEAANTAQAKANAAQAAAEEAAEALAIAKANAAQAAAIADAEGKITAEQQARIAQAEANLAAAESDAATKAAAAEKAAKDHADAEALAAKNAAISTAATDATTKAGNAETRAKGHADTVASTAKSEAISAAQLDAASKAADAQAAAISAAATDAANKAEAAKNTAISTAATDATNKAGAAESRAKTYAVEQVEAVEIGGRNLLENSANLSLHWEKDGYGTYQYLMRIDIRSIVPKIKIGDVLTFSFDVQMEAGYSLRVYDSNGNPSMSFGSHMFSNIGSEKQRLSFTATIQESSRTGSAWIMDFYNQNNGDKFTIEKVKIEHGNKATAWEPAPEDYEADATAKAAAAEAAAVSTAAADATSKANAAESGAVSTAAADASSKASAAESAAKTFATGEASTAKSQAISTAAGDATTKANAAEGRAVSTAAGDATSKANAAESRAKTAAATDATTKANAAESAAKTFATGEANAAGSAALASAKEYRDLWAYPGTTFINGGNLYNNSVTTNQLAAGAVTADIIAANAISAAKIASNAITAVKIAADAVTAGKIAADAVTAREIAADAVTAEQIAAGSITTDLLSAAGIDGKVIKAGTLSGDRIMANSLDADRLKAGSVIAGDITFTGTLEGADGTFSGILESVGDNPEGGQDYVTIANGFIGFSNNNFAQSGGYMSIDPDGFLIRAGATSFSLGYLWLKASTVDVSTYLSVGASLSVTEGITAGGHSQLNGGLTTSSLDVTGPVWMGSTLYVGNKATVDSLDVGAGDFTVSAAGSVSMRNGSALNLGGTLSKLYFGDSNDYYQIKSNSHYFYNNTNYFRIFPSSATYTDIYTNASWVDFVNTGVSAREFRLGTNSMLTMGQSYHSSSAQYNGEVYSMNELWLRSSGTLLRLDDTVAALLVRTGDDQLYAEAKALKFTVMSDRKAKKNFEVFNAPASAPAALAAVKKTPVWKYRFINEDGLADKSLGLIADEAPAEIVAEDGEGVDVYAMAALLWKALQELDDRVDSLEGLPALNTGERFTDALVTEPIGKLVNILKNREEEK